jgi:hypothetical protein
MIEMNSYFSSDLSELIVALTSVIEPSKVISYTLSSQELSELVSKGSVEVNIPNLDEMEYNFSITSATGLNKFLLEPVNPIGNILSPEITILEFTNDVMNRNQDVIAN